MASRRLLRSASTATKAHYAYSRPSLLCFRTTTASAQSSWRLSSPNPFIGFSGNNFSSVTVAAAHSQLLPLSFQFSTPRGFAAKAFKKYGTGLTELARQGKLDPFIGRDGEIRRCLHILCRKTKNNPCIVGEPGVGKTAIVEGLAQRVVRGDISL